MKAHKTHTDPRSRLIALVLLCVFAHALVVCLFHHHASLQTDAAGSRIVSDCAGHRDHSPVTGGDSECLSCRLHRSFLSDLRPPLISLDIDSQTARACAADQKPRSLFLISTLHGRAPPLA